MGKIILGFWLKEVKERVTVVRARITNSVKLSQVNILFEGPAVSSRGLLIMMDVCIDQAANGNISSAVENRPLCNYQNNTWPCQE